MDIFSLIPPWQVTFLGLFMFGIKKKKKILIFCIQFNTSEFSTFNIILFNDKNI